MSFIILFKDKQKLQVSDVIAEKLKVLIRQDKTKTFELGPSMYSISGVDKIVPKQEAYDIFPNDYSLLSAMEDVKINDKALTI